MEKRLFIPGSEWLYFKLYCGNKTADAILTDNILPLVDRLLSEGWIDKWFFIRYSDPEFHIRFRLHVPKVENYGQVFAALYPVLEKLVEHSSLSKVMCDSYNRELERYGESRYRDTETLFYADSACILQILRALKESPDSDLERWPTALQLIDDMLNGFGLTAHEKRDFMFSQSEGFKKEFGYVSIPFVRQLNDKYRENRQQIESVFSETDNNFSEKINHLFSERREKIEKLRFQMFSTSLGDKAECYGYLSSAIHMTMNRLFYSSNRMYEMVIYDFIYRQYKSQIARANKN
ncbi:MAG: thiopeptide-type bacteriocin biosynthesis protein [Bacteroidales bacterium]